VRLLQTRLGWRPVVNGKTGQNLAKAETGNPGRKSETEEAKTAESGDRKV
jgi:hypothetical protein